MKTKSDIHCAVCGERAGNTGSMAGLVHQWGPTDHAFEHKPSGSSIEHALLTPVFLRTFARFATVSTNGFKIGETYFATREHVDGENDAPWLVSLGRRGDRYIPADGNGAVHINNSHGAAGRFIIEPLAVHTVSKSAEN